MEFLYTSPMLYTTVSALSSSLICFLAFVIQSKAAPMTDTWKLPPTSLCPEPNLYVILSICAIPDMTVFPSTIYSALCSSLLNCSLLYSSLMNRKTRILLISGTSTDLVYPAAVLSGSSISAMLCVAAILPFWFISTLWPSIFNSTTIATGFYFCIQSARRLISPHRRS